MKSFSSFTRLATIITATVLKTFFASSVNAQQSKRTNQSARLAWEYKVVPWSEITEVQDKYPDQLFDQKNFPRCDYMKSLAKKAGISAVLFRKSTSFADQNSLHP